MRKIAVLSLFLCLVAVCRAQYIGSQYMNVKLGYIVDESQVQGTFGFGKVYKAFKVGANLNYRNLNRDLVKANTVTVGPEAGLLRPERTEILAPGDRSRDDRLPESQGEKRSCVPGEKQGFRVWVRGRDKAGNVAKPESGSFCRIQV